VSITVHQRRAAKAARERLLKLSRYDAMLFARPMRILAGSEPFRIIRVNYRRGTMRVEGLIGP